MSCLNYQLDCQIRPLIFRFLFRHYRSLCKNLSKVNVSHNLNFSVIFKEITIWREINNNVYSSYSCWTIKKTIIKWSLHFLHKVYNEYCLLQYTKENGCHQSLVENEVTHKYLPPLFRSLSSLWRRMKCGS